MVDKTIPAYTEWVAAAKHVQSMVIEVQAKRDAATEASRRLQIAQEELRQTEVSLWAAFCENEGIVPVADVWR